jgi:hypothetical protein
MEVVVSPIPEPISRYFGAFLPKIISKLSRFFVKSMP